MNRLTLVFIALFSLNLSAAEIYQVIDENGNKVFTNIEPKSSAGKTVQKVELKQTNTTASSNPIDEDGYLQQKQQERQEQESQLAKFEQQQNEARRAVREAEQDLEQARELQSGDYFNIPGKGMRYKESYYERVKLAEDKLQQAKEQLQSLQKNDMPASSTPQ